MGWEGLGRLFLTEWIRKCFTDEGIFEMGPEESGIQTWNDGRKRIPHKGQDERTHAVRKCWRSGENRAGRRAGRVKWGSWGSYLEGWVGPTVKGFVCLVVGGQGGFALWVAGNH